MAIKAFSLDLTSEQATGLADRLQSLVALGLICPSIVAPIAAGLEGGTPYLVEEYVFGESLDVALRRYGPAPAADAARLITQVAAALDVASLVGVLHGALHLRDVLVTPDLVRLTGLGILGALERTGLRPLARRPYSAPERNEGQAWDSRADVFSLAGVATELLTGRPFTTRGRDLVPDFAGILVARPEELRQVLSRGLALNPGRRYQAAGDFAAALELALTGRSSRPARVGGAPRDALARPGEAVRVRRPKRRQEAAASSEIEPPIGTAGPLQPTLADAADEIIRTSPAAQDSSEGDHLERPGPSEPAQPEVEQAGADLVLARVDALQNVHAEAEVLPIEIAPPLPATPDVGDALPLSAPEPERTIKGSDAGDAMDLQPGPGAGDSGPSEPPAAGPEAEQESWDLTEPAEIESPATDAAPSAATDDLRLESSGSLPFDDREPTPPAPVIGQPDIGDAAEDLLQEAHVDEFSMGRRPGSLALPVALALAAGLVVGTYGGYRIGIRSVATPVGSATTSVLPAAPVPAAPAADIYLPAAPEFAGTESTGEAATARPPAAKIESTAPSPGARAGSAATRKSPAKATTAPRATTPSTAAPRQPAGKAAFGSLAIESRPAGARVFVDGRLSGTTPLVLPKVAAGSHQVRIERTGYRQWSSTARVTSGHRARVAASLEPESAR